MKGYIYDSKLYEWFVWVKQVLVVSMIYFGY